MGKLVAPTSEVLGAKLRAYSETLTVTKELTSPLRTHEERKSGQDRALVNTSQSKNTGGGTRTHEARRPADFKSAAYASSATPASLQSQYLMAWDLSRVGAGCTLSAHKRHTRGMLSWCVPSVHQWSTGAWPEKGWGGGASVLDPAVRQGLLEACGSRVGDPGAAQVEFPQLRQSF